MSTALKFVGAAVLLVILAAGGWFAWGYYHTTTQGVTFRTEKITKGNLTATISSTGTIEPEEVIDVGAQVAGQIKAFGPDRERSGKTVDWCSNVKEGDVLAYLDDSLYQARVNQTEATVKSAEADLRSKQASRAAADRDWERAQRLRPTGGISELDYDTARATHDTTTAAVGVAEATIGLAKAQLAEAKVNLGYTVVKSPVNGVIVDRRVNIGQTVVASLSAPSLFLIAKDLKRLQVWVSVNEADVGNIKLGQKAVFTVDAYPGVDFQGVVTKVRLNAMMTQNVVTYTVEVTTNNDDLKLLPYLTANVKFLVNERKDAKLVPNGALRWRPPAGGIGMVHPDFRAAYEQSLRRKSAADDKAGGEKEHQNRGTVWVVQDGFARPVKVTTGLTDGISTEILDVPGEHDKSVVDFDTPVIIGESKGGPSGSVNPFVTPMFGGKKKE